MKRIFKKTLAVILAVVMTVGAAPLAGLVGLELPSFTEIFTTKAEAATSGYYTYTVSDGEAKITDVASSISGDIVIPSKLGSYRVTSIGYDAFGDCNNITSVTIPNSITYIDWLAFNVCDSLENIIVDSSNPNYSNDEFGTLFNKDKTELIQYPIGNTRTSYSIPDSVISLGDNSFEYCDNLASVTIPDSVTSINNDVFLECDNLASVTIGNGVIYIGVRAFEDCDRLTSITIPDSVININNYVFSECDNLSNVTIGNSVTSMGVGVFYNCPNLANVTISDGATIIGDYAFEDCNNLASITIPDSVTSIGAYAFYNCQSLESVTIGNGVISIGGSAFKDCQSLESISIGNGVTSIGTYAFYETKYYNNVNNWDDDVLYIGKYLIEAKDSISDSYNVKDGTLAIADYAVSGCDNLAIVTLPNSLKSIGTAAFQYCKNLASIKIPNSVTSIGNSAFYYCTALDSVTIPDSVTSIGSSVFYDTKYYNNSSNWDNNVLYIGKYLIDAKGSISDSYEIKDGTLAIARSAFFGCNSLVNITIPDSVTSIGDSAFYDCTSLESATIPDSVTSISDRMFEGCTNFASVIIPDGITNIGERAFYGCEKLSSVTIPDSVTTIGESAFEDCKKLASIKIPEGVIVIEENLFYNCSNLTSITIPDSVILIDSDAIRFCSYLKDVYYDGAYNDWSKIVICSSNNYTLSRASLHYTYYYVSWYINGELLKEDRVKVGESIAVPTEPEVVGYTFIGWNKNVPSNMPEQNLSFNAVLKTKQYTVKWNIDGDVQEDTFDYGEVITVPTPEKEGMFFLGWDKDIPSTMPAENLEFTARWSETLFEYELDESIGGIVITGAKNASGDIEIPAKIDGYKVKLIASGAFIGSDITSVTIPESVVFVQELAFAFCEKLETVNLSSNLAGVGEATFVGCKNIKEINIPADSEYLTTDEYGVIYTKDFATLIYAPTYAIGDTYAMHPSTTTVLDYSFADCDDFTLTLSDKLVVNDDSEFFNVLSVNGFVTSDACTNYKAVDGVLYNKDVTKLIKYPVDSDRELLIIPESVKSIAGNYSFMSMSGNLMMYFVSGLPCDENTFDNLYKEPQYLTVHISSKNSLDGNSLACLTFGPSHICIGDISESDVSYFDNEIEYVITQIEAEWSEAEDDLTPGTNEYYFSKVLILGYIDLLSSFIDCENDHTRLHKYAEVVDEKTGDCTTDGYTSYNCECGYEFTDVTTAQGHDYEITVTEPSCTEMGYTTHTCSVCGDTYIDGESGGEGHQYNSVETKVTCTTDGYTTHTCSVCGDTYIDGEIASEGHKYEAEITKNPTCTTTGLKTFTCHCGDSYTEVINVNGHSKGEWEYIGGNEYAKNCTVCGDKLESKIVAVNMTFNGENVNRKQILNKSTATVVATVTDNFANNLVFASSDDSVVSVDANGNVVANDIGKATITVTINGTAISDSIEVEVLPRDFTITWNVNGKQTKQIVKEYATVTPNVNTTLPGYKFIGWDSEVPSTMPAENLLFTAIFELSFKMSIRNPSTTTISYGDSIILHADMNEALPSGWIIKWTVDNGNFSYSASAYGKTCTISPNKSGDTTFTATVYDENGNEICKDTQTMKSKAGFFDKFIAFFKKIFGATKVIPQVFNGVF